MAFYEAAAQIIPVLLLVLAVERGMFRTERITFFSRSREYKNRPARAARLDKGFYWFFRVFNFVTFAFIVNGELIALRVLQRGKASDWHCWMAWTTISVEFAWI